MANEYTLGIYVYDSKVSNLNKLPPQLKEVTISPCGVLLKLLMGKMKIRGIEGGELYNQKLDYTKLPAEDIIHHTYEQFIQTLGVNILDDDINNSCNIFFARDRCNNFVYEHMLFEVSQFFLVYEKSPCEGFVHLYRMLEFMSYSFPLLYASKSRNYRGTYESLKKFLKGDGGELKFFTQFLKTLFEGDIVYDYMFEIVIESDNIEGLRSDFRNMFTMDYYVFEGDTLTIKFKNLMDLFVEIRNRFFHMLLGQGRNNFWGMSYDKNDLFRALNPHILNWITMIYVKIIQCGLESTES